MGLLGRIRLGETWLIIAIVVVSLMMTSVNAEHVDAEGNENDDLEEYKHFCARQSRLIHHPETIKDDCKHTDKKDFHDNDLRVLFSLFAIILWGAIVRTLLKAFDISLPYTVVLMISGILVGLASKYECYDMYTFTAIARTSPEIILFTFLPVLIFETSFGISDHVFMKAIVQILLTSFPGMIIATFLTAGATMAVFSEYKWSFLQACFYGSIISATDPVAVVAILKELGASEVLSVLIDGESLLNDGVAILLYEMFKDLLELEQEGIQLTAGELSLKVFRQFMQIAVGGPILGYILAKITIFFLGRVFHDATVEITITLVATYMTYYLAEAVLGVSGVMAVVALGITIKAEKTCISPETESDVHEFWEMLSHLANTVLFFICGIVITETALSTIGWVDVWYLVYLYMAITVIRFAMLLVMYPLLARTGYGINWQNMVVMLWGGLRGAVGICLSLEVHQSVQFCEEKTLGPKVLFLTAGIVFLTLVLNGTTTKKLLDLLRLTEVSPGTLEEMANAMRQINGAQRRCVTMLKHDRFLADANWAIVEKFTTITDPYRDLSRSTSAKKESSLITIAEKNYDLDHMTECPDCHNFVKNQPTVEEYRVIIEEARVRIIKAMKISYWTQFEAGMLTVEAVQVLINVAESVTDKPFYMVHTKDLQKFWATPGFIPVLRRELLTRFGYPGEIMPSRPPQKWRYIPYKIVCWPFWDYMVSFLIVVNMCTATAEIITITGFYGGSPCSNPTARFYYRSISTFFCTFYWTEFVLRFIGWGPVYLFKRKWTYVELVVIFTAVCDVILQNIPCGHEIQKWKDFYIVLRVFRVFRFFRSVRFFKPSYPLIIIFLNKRTNLQYFRGYELATGFITAIDEVLKFLHQLVENHNVYHKFKIHLEKERMETVREMGLLQKDHPGIAIGVKTRHASRAILNQMKLALQDLRIDGLIDEKESGLLSMILDDKTKRLWSSPPYIPPRAPEVLLENLNWVKGNNELRSRIAQNAALLNFSVGDSLLKVGSVESGLYIIVRGLVKVTYEPQLDVIQKRAQYGCVPNMELFRDVTCETKMQDFFSTGTVFGESGLLTGRPRAASVVCETVVLAYHIPPEAMAQALKLFNNPLDSLEARIWRSCAIRRSVQVLPSTPVYESWTMEKIQMHVERSAVPLGPEFDSFTIPPFIAEVFVIEGIVEDGHSKQQFLAPCLVPRNCSKLILRNNEEIMTRVMLIAYEDIGVPDEKDTEESLRLRRCIEAAYDLRRTAAVPIQPEQERSRRYSVAVNYGRRNRRKGRWFRVQDTDDDLRELRRRALYRRRRKHTHGGEDDVSLRTTPSAKSQTKSVNKP